MTLFYDDGIAVKTARGRVNQAAPFWCRAILVLEPPGIGYAVSRYTTTPSAR
jgi:hypothetical protein